MEMIYSRELGLRVRQTLRPISAKSFSITEALALYHRLKGWWKDKAVLRVLRAKHALPDRLSWAR